MRIILEDEQGGGSGRLWSMSGKIDLKVIQWKKEPMICGANPHQGVAGVWIDQWTTHHRLIEDCRYYMYIIFHALL